MKKITLLSLVVIILAAFTPVTKLSITDFVNKFNKAQVHSGAEKLFLHTDKPLYFAGEDIWFQSYLVSPSTNLPITYEKILYVELLSPSGVTIQKRMFKLENGKCNGTLTLKDNLSDGRYLILAYTNWMRNQGSDFFFKKEFTVVTEKKNPSIRPRESADTLSTETNNSNLSTFPQAEPTMANLQLTFMPEGGDLIAGMLSRVAFIGVNQSGKAMEFEGKVVDEEGNSYGNFKAMHKGKGYFILQAEANKRYKAIVIGNKGESLEFPLPEVKASGFSLKVENPFQGGSIGLSILSSGINPQSAFTLVAQQDGELKDILQGKLVDNQQQFKVSKHLFKTGIVHFTLFNQHMIPQCERLAFINHHNDLNIQIKGLENDFTAREKIDLEIEVKDKTGNPVQGEFSLAVTDAQKVTDDYYSAHNLVNYIHLTSNLPGKIDDPAYYLQENAQAHMATDLLMMVNGWRRFKWQEVLSDSIPSPEHAIEQGIYVNGKLKRPKSKKAVPKGMEVTMMMKGRILDGYSAKSDENGEFQFDVRPFDDTITVVVQTKNRLNRDAQFAIELESNLSFEAADFYARRLMVENAAIPTTFYEAEEIDATKLKAEKGGIKEAYRRVNEEAFFEDTTDVQIENIDVIEQRIRTPREAMTAMYGAPDAIVGTRQIEQLVEETPWQYGLMTTLYDAFPGLNITLIRDYNFSKSESGLTGIFDGARNRMQEYGRDVIVFNTLEGPLRKVQIYVDGRGVGSTDIYGYCSVPPMSMLADLVTLDPLKISSVELIRDVTPNDIDLNLIDFDSDYDLSFLDMYDASSFDRTEKHTILSIYTKTGAGVYSTGTKWGISNYKLHGFERTREFYSPKYNGKDDALYQRDERSTLHWEPTIKTDSSGKAKITFYNSDEAQKLRFDIAGFSAAGIPGASTITKGQEIDKTLVSEKNNEESKESFQTETLGQITNTNKLALISVASKNWSTVSNNEGKFDIDTNTISKQDTLLIEVPGEFFTVITVQELRQKAGKIDLSSIQSSSSANDAEKLVLKMVRNKSKMSSFNTYYLQAVYRESIFKGNDLYRVSDFSLYQRKEGYRSTIAPHYSMPVKGRIFHVENYSNHIKYEPLNSMNDLVPLMDPLNRKLSCLNSEYFDSYTYQLDGELMFQNRLMYKISFDQNDNVAKTYLRGYMLIDKETYGLAYINWGQSDKGKLFEAPQMFLMGSADSDNFERLHESNEAFFTRTKKGVWKLKMASQRVLLKMNNTKFSYNREFEVLENLDKKPKGFKYKTLDELDTRKILIKNVSYTPEKWRETWCLPAEDYIYKQIKYLHEVVVYE